MLIRISLFAFFLVFSSPVRAEEINAGFVQGLWYSSPEILEGVPVRIYVALRNNTPHDLVGTIRFMDNETRIGSAPVSALSGRLVEAWTDWTPSAGEHALRVALGDAELHVIGGSTIHVDVENIVVKDTRTADRDNDKDGIGNLNDTDDDNDAISDTDEVAMGSNPLVPNPKPTEKTPEETPPLPTPPMTPTVGHGLEQYFDEGFSRTVLGSVTEKVSETKQALDTYRKERSAEQSKGSVSPSIIAPGTATITRSTIETNDTLLKSFVSGTRALLQHSYTFVLFVLSNMLAHPALLQIGILIGILYFFYRTAKRLARRPR